MVDLADKIAETFNNFFTSVISNFNIPWYMDSSIKTDHIKNEILSIVEEYKNLTSIASFKNENLNNQFSFRSIPKSEIKTEISNNLAVSKAS